MTYYLRMIGIYSLIVALCSMAVALGQCTSSCMVQISGLQATYSSNSIIEFSVHNTYSARREINVAVEALQSGRWTEVVASVTDAKHPYGKALRLTPIRAGATLNEHYKPLATKAQAERLEQMNLPISLRLRVDVINGSDGTVVQQIISEPFQLTVK